LGCYCFVHFVSVQSSLFRGPGPAIGDFVWGADRQLSSSGLAVTSIGFFTRQSGPAWANPAAYFWHRSFFNLTHGWPDPKRQWRAAPRNSSFLATGVRGELTGARAFPKIICGFLRGKYQPVLFLFLDRPTRTKHRVPGPGFFFTITQDSLLVRGRYRHGEVSAVRAGPIFYTCVGDPYFPHLNSEGPRFICHPQNAYVIRFRNAEGEGPSGPIRISLGRASLCCGFRLVSKRTHARRTGHSALYVALALARDVPSFLTCGGWVFGADTCSFLFDSFQGLFRPRGSGILAGCSGVFFCRSIPFALPRATGASIEVLGDDGTRTRKSTFPAGTISYLSPWAAKPEEAGVLR